MCLVKDHAISIRWINVRTGNRTGNHDVIVYIDCNVYATQDRQLFAVCRLC